MSKKQIWTAIVLVLMGIFFLSENKIRIEQGDISTYNDNEIIFYVELTSNSKSEIEIERFSEHYQSIVNKNEPNTFSWAFFESEPNKMIEIIRWSDSEAIKKHIKNISEGGIFEKDFFSYVEHFIIEKIHVYGEPTEEVKQMLRGIGVPITFNSLISGYSR